MRKLDFALVVLFFVAEWNFSIAQTSIPGDADKYDVIAALFEEQVDPYLKHFAQNSYGPNSSSQLIDSQYRIFKQKCEFVRTDLKREIQQSKSPFSNDQILKMFDFSYRNNFPGLDFAFFEKVNLAAKAKLK